MARMYLSRITPTLIISDIHLPGENGIELLHWVRSQPPPLGNVPVVMLTVSTDRVHQLHAYALRALLFLNKPIQKDVLLDALRAHMLQGTGLAGVAPQLGILLGWLVVCFVLALRLFRWK